MRVHYNYGGRDKITKPLKISVPAKRINVRAEGKSTLQGVAHSETLSATCIPGHPILSGLSGIIRTLNT